MISLIILLCAIIVCLFLSAFFSSCEMAYSSANRIRLENLSEKNDKKAKRALYITENYDKALSSILIGNNLANIASSSLGSVVIYMMFENPDNYTWISTTVLTILVILFGETIPKIKSKKNATNTALSYSFAMRALMVILSPVASVVVFLVNIITKPLKGQIDNDDIEESVEELQSIIETAENEGVLDEDDSEIIQNAIDFSDIAASEVMTARVDVKAIDIDDSWDDILEFVSTTPYSRIPVYSDSIDNIIGVVHLNRFFKEVAENNNHPIDIRTIMLEPCYVYKTMKLPSVLKTLREARQHLAIVTDEYSGTLGVVTMEDVLEQIVGDIWDESDTVERDIVQKTDNVFELDGDLPIAEFTDLLDIDESEFEAESETVGGWVIEMLDRFPKPGENFEYKNLSITALKTSERRVDRVLVKKNGAE